MPLSYSSQPLQSGVCHGGGELLLESVHDGVISFLRDNFQDRLVVFCCLLLHVYRCGGHGISHFWPRERSAVGQFRPWPVCDLPLDVCDLLSWLWGPRTLLVALLHLTWALFPERSPQGSTGMLLRNDSGTPELRSWMPWMSSQLPFMFFMRKLRFRNKKKLTWSHTARPLMIQNRHGGHRHS